MEKGALLFHSLSPLQDRAEPINTVGVVVRYLLLLLVDEKEIKHLITT
jgi:hypothetical protein